MAAESIPDLAFNPAFRKKVDELELSVRSANCLKNDNIVYIGDLVAERPKPRCSARRTSAQVLNEIRKSSPDGSHSAWKCRVAAGEHRRSRQAIRGPLLSRVAPASAPRARGTRMRHGNAHRKLNRTAEHRRAMFATWRPPDQARADRDDVAEGKGAAADRESGLRSAAWRLHARRRRSRSARSADGQKLFEVLGPRYKDRNGGYTRVLKAASAMATPLRRRDRVRRSRPRTPRARFRAVQEKAAESAAA